MNKPLSYTAWTTIPNWGKIGVTVTPNGLTAVHWGAEQGKSASPSAESPLIAALRCAANQWLAQIREYLEGKRCKFSGEIAWESLPPFQRAVLQFVAQIPYGKTMTYGEVAARIGKPRAARAVGRALATNPMPIVIPCHRVLAANGGLGGYSGAGGIATKRRLLALESQNKR